MNGYHVAMTQALILVDIQNDYFAARRSSNTAFIASLSGAFAKVLPAAEISP